MSNPRDLLRFHKAPPPLAVPMQTEVRSDGGMKLHMLQAPSWNQNPGATSILRWSGSVSTSSISALWQTLVEPDPSGNSAERLINDWTAKQPVAGCYLGTFVTEPLNGNFGPTVEVQVLFTTQGDPALLLTEITQAGSSAPVALQGLLTNYGLTPDSSSNPWAAQKLSFPGSGACILPWQGVLRGQADVTALRNFLGTNTVGTTSLPEKLINDALAALLVGYYLGTFVDKTATKVQVLFGLNSTLRSDEKLGNPNHVIDNEYGLRTILQNMSDTIQSFPNALVALQGLLQNIGSSVNSPDPPWFMLSQMDPRVIDPNAP